VGDAPATFQLKYVPPFDWDFFLRYFHARSTPGVEVVIDGRYVRTISVSGARGVLSVEHFGSKHGLRIAVSGAARDHVPTIRPRIARMFDLAADIRAVHRSLLSDARLRPLVQSAPGIRVPGAWSAFEVIARAIVGQQVSVKAASTIMGRITQRVGRPVKCGEHGQVGLLFPLPRAVAEADLTSIGMPGKRIAALKGVARAIAEKSIPFSDTCDPIAGVKDSLLELPGIGPWTVEYFALRALRDPDAWPGTDLVLRRALVAGTTSRPPSLAELLQLTTRWRPWRAYAAVHLWNASSENVP
jgi:DNA-3-methyladenine glycosylase II